MDKFQYGGLLFDPSHYQTLSYIESKHNNKLFINPDFKKGKAGYMQLSPIAFADLKEQGFFKDREYSSLTPQEVLAGSMKYASRLGEHYGFTDPKWNAAAYNMGPSKARELYNKYAGKLNKAVLDPAFPQTTKDYLFDYNYTTLTKERHGNEDVNKMYDIIKNDRDVNSLDIAPIKKAMGDIPRYQVGGNVGSPANVINPNNKYGYYTKTLGVDPVLDSVIVENGAPNYIYDDEKIIDRPSYDPKGHAIIIGKNFTTSHIIAEVAHAKQFQPKVYNETYTPDTRNDAEIKRLDSLQQKENQLIKDNPQPAYTGYTNAGDSLRYVTPGTIEHDAHSVIEPEIQKDYKMRYDRWKSQQDTIPKKAMGGIPKDVNSLNIDAMAKKNKTPKYFWGALIQAGVNKIKEEKAKDKAFMNSSNMGAAGTALGSMITSAGDAIGTQ